MAPIEKLERRKRRDIAVIRLKEALFPPQSPVSMRPALLLGSVESWARSLATIVVRKDTMQGIVPNPRKTLQKSSDGLNNLHFDDWSSLLPWNTFLTFDIQFESEKIEKKLWQFQ